MDFIILKINGNDVTKCSHDEALKYFNEAPERFLVEIARKKQNSDEIECCEQDNVYQNLHLNDDFTVQFNSLEKYKNHNSELKPTQISLGKILNIKMTKSNRNQPYGLTLSYELIQVTNEPPITSVYISEIETNSIASSIKELEVGDEIIGINEERVQSRDHVIDLFGKSKLEINLIVRKVSSQINKNGPDEFLQNLRETDIISSETLSQSSSHSSVVAEVNPDPYRSNQEWTQQNQSIEYSQTYSGLICNSSSHDKIRETRAAAKQPITTIDLLKDMPYRFNNSNILDFKDSFDVEKFNENRNVEDDDQQHGHVGHDNAKIYANLPATMEWVIKKRQDGTRYITRRPKRNQILRERARQVIAERTTGITTDDDAKSEIKLGRYWSRSDRRSHLRKYRRLRNKRANATHSRNTTINEMVVMEKSQISDGLTKQLEHLMIF